MLRMAVLGAGRIGAIHAANAAANARAALVAISDPAIEPAEALARSLSCEAVPDAASVIARPDIDAVVIGTPTDTHIALMRDAVRSGKAVLCEKPIDLDLAKVDAALPEIVRWQGRVMIAFNRRFDPTADRMHRAIAAGEIGAVRQIVITSRDPALPTREYLSHSGGIFRDMVIHDLDMARWLLGEEPVAVSAVGSRLVDPTLTKEVGDFDTVMLLLSTASGRQCHINCCRETVYGYDQRIEVLGSEGMLLNDNLRATTLRRWTGEGTDTREALLDFFLARYAEAYRRELDGFIDAVETGAPMPITPEDGRQALRLADCAQQSVESGRQVAV